MKFSTRTDKNIPAEKMFDAVGDFDRMERVLIRRGVSVRRVDNSTDATRSWDLGFDWRGQKREMKLALVQFDRPEKLGLKGRSRSFDLQIGISVVALSRKKSRVVFEFEVRPRNMRARLAIQTAKLGKSKLDKKFAQSVADFVNDAVDVYV